MTDPLTMRVAARWEERQADQAPGQRQRARKLTQPINKTKGVKKQILKDMGKEMPPAEKAKSNRRDIRPKDVFTPTPDNVGVKNFAETGKDLQKAIDKDIPKDKGYETVKNLSQYLIRTEGGGEGGAEGTKT